MTITSRHNPLVARFRDAARGDAGAVMLLDGPHLVGDALAAKIVVTLAAVTQASLAKPDIHELVTTLSQRGINVATVTAAVMDAISPLRSPSGIVALADRPAARMHDIYARPAPLAVLAVDVQDPGNLGAIVRVAEAAGATGVVAAGASANPFGWKALRGSMGSALRLPIGGGDPQAAVDGARRHRCRIVATVPRAGRMLFEIDLTGPIALLIGGEGAGLPEHLVAMADERVTIPMQPPVESLNAAVTAAVVLYEARRQRSTTTRSETRARSGPSTRPEPTREKTTV
ncbi:MAG TPA: RNA methyltransferase [Vicinamibacterales bacterium]|nr:RNA methyltransferase [Vicinamibacterales bacterium]